MRRSNKKKQNTLVDEKPHAPAAPAEQAPTPTAKSLPASEVGVEGGTLYFSTTDKTKSFTVDKVIIYYWDESKDAVGRSDTYKNIQVLPGKTQALLVEHMPGCSFNSNTLIAASVSGVDFFHMSVSSGAFNYHSVLCLTGEKCYRSTTDLDSCKKWRGVCDTGGCLLLGEDLISKQFDDIVKDCDDESLKEKLEKNKEELVQALWNDKQPPLELDEVFNNIVPSFKTYRTKDENKGAPNDDDLADGDFACAKAIAWVCVDFMFILMGMVGVAKSLLNNIRTNFALNLERHLADEVPYFVKLFKALESADGLRKKCMKLADVLGGIYKIWLFWTVVESDLG